MNTTPAIRRRVFLAGAVGAGVSLIAGPPWSWPLLGQGDEVTAERLLGLLADGDVAVALGREYLRLVPKETDAGVLKSLLVHSLSRDHRTIERATDERLRESVRRASVDDFERQNTFELDGWILARTEARLCALAAAWA